MKRILLSTLILALTINLAVAQTIRRVNSNVGISGVNVYSTFAAAHTAAAANDIIIVEPSATSYGDVVITKPLKIYGNGYLLTTNTELKVDQRSSIFGTIEFNTGSDGSEIYGITSGSWITVYGVSNITISRNYMGQYAVNIVNANKANTTTTNVSNIVISRNFGSSIGSSYIIATPTGGKTISNVIITNNIMGYISASDVTGIQNWIIRNNTFHSPASNTALVNSVLENNFFYAGGSSPSMSNTTYSYNVSSGGTFSGGFNNVNNYDYVTNAEITGNGTGISADEFYIIKAGSQLKTLGNGGIEVGAYGGSTPYIVSGIPPIPSIVNMINSGTGDNSNPLKVTISVKSNN